MYSSAHISVYLILALLCFDYDMLKILEHSTPSIFLDPSLEFTRKHANTLTPKQYLTLSIFYCSYAFSSPGNNKLLVQLVLFYFFCSEDLPKPQVSKQVSIWLSICSVLYRTLNWSFIWANSLLFQHNSSLYLANLITIQVLTLQT